MENGGFLRKLFYSGGHLRNSTGLLILATGTLILFVPPARIPGFALCLAGASFLYFSSGGSAGIRSLHSTISFYVLPVLTAITLSLPFLFSYLSSAMLNSGIAQGVKQSRFDSSFMMYAIAEAALGAAVIITIVVSAWGLALKHDRAALIAAVVASALLSVLVIYWLPASVLNRYNLAISDFSYSTVIQEATAYPAASIWYWLPPSAAVSAILVKMAVAGLKR